ncbi:MAG TPA: acylase [Kofleriaceae bacterium]|nr:acylase [Kofleriaceae bacterium]
MEISRACLLLLALGCGSAPGTPPAPAAAAPTAAAPAAAAAAAPARAYRATIRWTSHGIPHVTAQDLGGLAFGQGYAFATHHVCVLADQIVKLRSERAKLLGPGDGDANIESDFGWLALELREQARRALPALSPETAALLGGFTAGYNRYLTDTRPDALPPDCAGAAWVRPIDEVDLLSHWIQLGVIGSSGYFLEAIAAAQPPGAGKSARRAPLPPAPDLRRPDAPASNGWAIGAERSANGRGMLVANPHFPWEGELRFFESHVTIPGTLDAYGASLLGAPLVQIGFTEHHAWTHTFSSSSRFILYRLELDPASPTRYRYAGETRAMTSREHAISVRQPDGSLRELRRRTYRSHHGPMIANAQLPWTAQHAFVLHDVAGGALGAIDQYLAMIRARDLPAFEAALARWQATGFVNTIYADREGNALYVDGSAVPDLSPAALGALRLARVAIPELAAAWKRGVVIADGSSPLFALAADPASPRPGAIPYARAPRLLRRDFVANANDSYWLTNPAAPLTGFSPLYGEPGTPPSARTRMNLRLLQSTGDGWPAGADGKLTPAELEAAILDHRAMTAELLRPAVVARCRDAARRRPKDAAKLARACDVLAQWDGRYDVESRGAVLWRELFAAQRDALYAQPFDPARPLDTPAGLAPAPKTGDDPVIAALAGAIAQLERAGVDPFGALGAAQWVDKRGRKIPVPGSGIDEGSTNPAYFSTWNTTRLPRTTRGDLVHAATGLVRGGYLVNYGSTFLLVVGFTDAGPTARALLTYSASSDPRSPHFTDQTERYSRKEWRPALFRAADIAADPSLRVQELCSPRC